MSMRDLIPWGRQDNRAPVPYRGDESNSLLGLRRDVDRLFDDLFRGSFGSFGLGRGAVPWPYLEISESDQEVRISAEVPGLSEEDVELLVEDGILTLRGEKKDRSEDKQRGYSELCYGRFERRIALPATVDSDQAEASFRDGILEITLPKSAELERGRLIPINRSTKH